MLNEETQKNARVFMTIAVDLVLNGLQDPVRFCIETKVRVYPQNEKFWVYQKHKHFEQFFLQISRTPPPTSPTFKVSGSPSATPTPLPGHTNQLSLQSIYSSTELVRKKHALEHQKKAEASGNDEQAVHKHKQSALNMSDDESDMVMSGLGNVSKDCDQAELIDWSEILAKWRKATWNERPKGLQTLVRRGKLTQLLFLSPSYFMILIMIIKSAKIVIVLYMYI